MVFGFAIFNYAKHLTISKPLANLLEYLLMDHKMLNRIIFVLAMTGMLIAGYVFYTYVTDSPIVCINRGCDLVKKSPYANMFGLPVPTFGLIGYFVIISLSFLYTTGVSWANKIPLIRFLISLGGFLFVAYLSFLEAFVIKGWCMWCVFSAIIMTVIFILSGIDYFSIKKFRK